MRFFLFKGVVTEFNAILYNYVFLLELLSKATCGIFLELITVVDIFLDVFELCFYLNDDYGPFVLFSFF